MSRPVRNAGFHGLLVMLLCIVASGRPVFAAGGDTYPADWKNKPLGAMYDTWGEATRYCTSWVAWALHDRNNYDLPFHGNAEEFGAKAAQHGITVDTHPATGSVAWWEGAAWNNGYGHVAYVDAVNVGAGGEVMTVDISEYNNPAGEGTYHTRTIAVRGPAGYIHFADAGTPRAGTQPHDPRNKRLVGDVNGDGKSDAVVVFSAAGNAKVALSNGGLFGYPGDWSYGQSVNATNYWLADVSGDAKADLVAYYASLRKWFVSISSGTGFWPPQEWSYDEPDVGDLTNAFLADVNGDSRADKVVFAAVTGNWLVSLSSGNGFWRLATWREGHGIGGTDQFLADFNNDQLADAAVYDAASGNWYIALSTGSTFGYPGTWAAAHGRGSTFRLVGDATGDGRADAIYYSSSLYKYWVGATTVGNAMSPLGEWSYDGSMYAHVDNAFTGDVNGDQKSDKILWFRGDGSWYVALSSGTGYWPLSRWIVGHGAGS